MTEVAISPGRIYTVADLESFPEDELWEVIDGVPFNMTAPCEDHQFISVQLTRQLANFLEGKPCQVFHAPYAVFMPKKGESLDESTTLVLPDLVVICDEKKRSQRGCRGGPDLVIEILSPSTSSRDQVIKRNLYETNGVKEYWVVDPVGRVLMISVRGKSGRFDRFLTFDDTMKVRSELFPALTFDLGGIFPKKPTRSVRQPAPTYGSPGKGSTTPRAKRGTGGSKKGR